MRFIVQFLEFETLELPNFLIGLHGYFPPRQFPLCIFFRSIRVMKFTSTLKAGIIGVALLAPLIVSSASRADSSPAVSPLAGTWTLVAADVVHTDGTRARDYGAAPKGLLLIDAAGHYSLQIFKSERPRFAAADKLAGTEAEYKAAVLGSSTHYGTVSIDATAHTLTFKIEAASFPNWEGAAQTRNYELKGDELSYRVPARPNGDTPISVWRRLN
jgi:Lipocalin-like domain